MTTINITPPALSEELEEHGRPSNNPKLSYSAAMRRVFLNREQKPVTVQFCTANDFSRLVAFALIAEKRKIKRAAKRKCIAELRDLNYDEHLSRWFALEVLQYNKIKVLLFETVQEAIEYRDK